MGVFDLETITCYVTTLWKRKYLLTMKGTCLKKQGYINYDIITLIVNKIC